MYNVHRWSANTFFVYTIEYLKRHVLNIQWSGIGNDLKQSTPTGAVQQVYEIFTGI
jgi:hypothetical protein